MAPVPGNEEMANENVVFNVPNPLREDGRFSRIPSLKRRESEYTQTEISSNFSFPPPPHVRQSSISSTNTESNAEFDAAETSFNSTQAVFGSYSSGEEAQGQGQLGQGHSTEVEGCSELDSFEDSVEGNSVIERLSRSVRERLFSVDRCDASTQTPRDPLTSETERLSFEVIFSVLGQKPPSGYSHPPLEGQEGGVWTLLPNFGGSNTHQEVLECLRKSVDKMLEKHRLVFNSMVQRLHVNKSSDLNKGFRELSAELFMNDEVNWAKIIALYAFAARLALYCKEQNFGNLTVEVAENLSQFAVERLTPFLRQHGGWATLCDAFPLETDYEATIWKSLVVTGLGLTAFATLLAMHSK